MGPLCTIDVEFAEPPRAPVTVKGESGKLETLPLYTANDTVRGQVNITPTAGKKIEHQGIKVELLGTIELFFDRGNTYDFCAMGACWPRERGVKP
jgi:vacuolar protein sorting-associated protein 26